MDKWEATEDMAVVFKRIRSRSVYRTSESESTFSPLHGFFTLLFCECRPCLISQWECLLKALEKCPVV